MKPTKSKGSDRELSPEKTQDIIEGAMQEFLANGFAATSMDKVANAAGVSKATVYSHFHDKVGLFKALIRRFAERQHAGIFQLDPAELLQQDPEVALRDLATQMLNVTMNNPEFIAFVRLVIGESGRFPELAQEFVRIFDQTGGTFLTQFFASHPKMTVADPEATARVFIGSLVHFVISQKIMHGSQTAPIDRDRFVKTLAHLIVAGN